MFRTRFSDAVALADASRRFGVARARTGMHSEHAAAKEHSDPSSPVHLLAYNRPMTTLKEALANGHHSQLPQYLQDALQKLGQFSKYDTRSYVIAASAFIDDLLRVALAANMISPTTKEDQLFSARGALYNLGPKIELAKRLSIISEELAWALDQIRKLRDKCAHSHEDISIETSDINDRVNEISKRIVLLEKNKLDQSPQLKLEYIFLATIYAVSSVTETANKPKKKLPEGFFRSQA